MFAIVDCNNFYASCERVFNARLRDRPVVVLSNNDGCVIARSNEAKALGFKMGDPYFKIRELAEQHGVTVFSSNYTLYGDMSSRVMETLRPFSPEIEEYSIDEAFLNFAHVPVDQLTAHAGEIRRTVKQWTGIPVSVGIGRTKTLSKVANHIAKKRPGTEGVFAIVTEEERIDTLDTFPIGEVWGIGSRWAASLARHGIATARQYAELPDDWIRRTMNVVALRTAWELRGESCIPLELAPPPRQSITVSRSFGRRLSTLEEIQEPLIAYISRAAEKLRQERMVAGHLLVFLHNSPHAKNEAFYGPSLGTNLPHQSSDTAELIRHACPMLARLHRPGLAYKKCGVILSDLSPEGQAQPGLFDQLDTDRSSRLMQALDRVNAQHGRNSLVYAGSGLAREWAAAAAMKSQHFTTNWQQVLHVRA
jgi:DNA polymerase V